MRLAEFRVLQMSQRIPGFVAPKNFDIRRISEKAFMALYEVRIMIRAGSRCVRKQTCFSSTITRTEKTPSAGILESVTFTLGHIRQNESKNSYRG